MAAAYKFIVCLSEIESPLFAKPNFSRLLHRLVVLMKGYVICFSNGKNWNWNIGQITKSAVIPIGIPKWKAVQEARMPTFNYFCQKSRCKEEIG